MNRRNLNLNIITKQYRGKGRAAKGYKNLSQLISQNDKRNLETTLRDHKIQPIWDNDLVEERDNIDFLIAYYSILEIGIIANYFPENLPESLKNEIKNILGNEYVKDYYSIYYPLILPQLLLRQIFFPIQTTENFYDQIKNALFEKFLVLNHSITTDKDVDQFLWFLDDGITGRYSINDLWDVLSSRETIKYKLGRNNTHPLNSSLFGFIKYIQFLQDYAELLRQTSEFKLLQSAFWHYQSYWFENMRKQLGDIITKGLDNIRFTIYNTNQNELLNDDNSYIQDSEDYIKWKITSAQFSGIEKDINYLLNQELGKPLRQLLKIK